MIAFCFKCVIGSLGNGSFLSHCLNVPVRGKQNCVKRIYSWCKRHFSTCVIAGKNRLLLLKIIIIILDVSMTGEYFLPVFPAIFCNHGLSLRLASPHHRAMKSTYRYCHMEKGSGTSFLDSPLRIRWLNTKYHNHLQLLWLNFNCLILCVHGCRLWNVDSRVSSQMISPFNLWLQLEFSDKYHSSLDPKQNFFTRLITSSGIRKNCGDRLWKHERATQTVLSVLARDT